MTASKTALGPDWIQGQVEKFAKLRPAYESFAKVLRKTLQEAAATHAPLAIVQARAKTIASFTEKILRKHPKKGKEYDPVNEFTDLCGARVITLRRSEVEAMGAFIKSQFAVDWENSVDTTERLKPTEFGYRSVHYIVSFKEGRFPHGQIPDEVFRSATAPMRGEIQVRTLLEHAWADLAHDLSYKSAFRVPQQWQREIARMAAVLEGADSTFDRIHEGLRRYAANYGGYMTGKQLDDEMALLGIVLKYDPSNATLADRLARLAMTKGDWDMAIAVLSPHESSDDPVVLRDLGVAKCKRFGRDRTSEGFRQGRAHLERAKTLAPRDVDTIASLAGTWKGEDDERARNLYREAYELDPTDPYPLGSYLEYALAQQGGAQLLPALKPTLRAGIQRSRDQVMVNMNMPWAFYNMGKLYLFLDEPYESLWAHARAVHVSQSDAPILGSLESIEKLRSANGASLRGLQWVRRFLLAARVAKLRALQNSAQATAELKRIAVQEVVKQVEKLESGSSIDKKDREDAQRKVQSAREALEAAEKAVVLAKEHASKALQEFIQIPDLATKTPQGKVAQIERPVVIVGGGTDPSIEGKMQGYHELMLGSFRDFRGTVISGGTRAGVSRLVGEVAEQYGASIHTLAYLPHGTLPPDAQPDLRYNELRYTDAETFTPLEPLQNWIDIIASGIDPVEVKVLGINGGVIAATEYRIALAMGARVGVLEESGREATKLLADEDWAFAANLIRLPEDPATVRAFIGPGVPKLDPNGRKLLAQAIHEQYVEDQVKELRKMLADWKALADNLKESSAQQADHIFEKLRQIGCEIDKPDGRPPALMTFTDKEIEIMGEMEHGRWNVERLLDGWKYGPEKDRDRKISPYLVSWRDLPEDVKQWDRNTVRAIPQFLAKLGLEVRRKA